MGLWIAGITVELREVKLANKPTEMIEASPKATVPVLVQSDGTVVDESIDLLRWSLGQNDPEDWLAGDVRELLDLVDGPFKHHLDRYKYWTRYDTDPIEHRDAALEILRQLDKRIAMAGQLNGKARSLIDIASFPFIRQFANHDRAWFDAQPIPHLHKWLADHLESDLFKAIMPKFTPWKEGDDVILFGPDQVLN